MKKIKAKTRETGSDSKLANLREEGFIPGVVYGHGFESEPVRVEKRAFSDIYEQVGQSELFDLDLEGEEDELPVLVQDLQRDPITSQVIHVDFYRIRPEEEIKTTVPLSFEGEAPVEEREGTVVKQIREIAIETMPEDLPSQIEVDISGLEDFEDKIRIEDMDIPEGVKILRDPNDTVVSVSRPTTEEELEALEEKPEELVEEVETVGEEEEEPEEVVGVEPGEEIVEEEEREEKEEKEETQQEPSSQE